MAYVYLSSVANAVRRNLPQNILKYSGCLHDHNKIQLMLTLLVVALLLFKLISRIFKSRAKLVKVEKTQETNLNKTFQYAHTLLRFKLPVIDGLFNLFQLGRHGVKVLDDMTERFGYQFKFQIGPISTYVVGDAEYVQKVLGSTQSTHLNKPQELYGFLFVDFMKDGLLNSKYEVWSPHRKMISRCFTYNALLQYLNIMNKHGNIFTNKLNAIVAGDGNGAVNAVQIHDTIHNAAMNIINEIVVGEGKFSEETVLKFANATESLKVTSIGKLFNPLLHVPLFWYLFPKRRKFDDDFTFLKGFLQKITTDYRKKRETLISEGLYSQYFQDEDGVGNKPFRCVIEEMLFCGASDKEVYDQVGTLILAGRESTMVTMELLLQNLALNPACQELCQAEIDEVLAEKTDLSSVTMDDLKNLKCVERCIMESGRLTSTVPVISRKLETRLKVNDNIEFPADSVVTIFPWVVHRNPKYFPDPMKFDPDRFLPENIKERHPYAYIPFLAGPRNCVGWKVSMMEMKLLTAGILAKYNVFTRDKLEDVKIKIAVTVAGDRLFDIFLKPRDKSKLNAGV